MCCLKTLPLLLLTLLTPRSASAQDAASVAPDTALAGTFDLLRLEEGTYEAEPYTLAGEELRRVTRSYAADFGALAVPERRGQPGSRQIELPIVRLRATGTQPAEPIFWLDGGPGQTNMRTFDFDYFIEKHDHVMVGYRGVDGPVSLDCPEVTRVLKRVDDVLLDETLDRVGEAYAACWDRLRGAGVNLHGYTTVEVVKDLESARRALGYERINVVAESYGTRLAYLYGVMYPEHINRTMMVGANPPGGLVWDPAQADAFIRHYARLWAEDPDARTRTGDLAAAIQTVNQDMPRRWLLLPIHPGNVKASAHAMLFHRDSAAMVFDAYVAAANGDPSGLWMISVVAPFIFPEIVNWGDNASKAVSAEYNPARAYARELAPDDAVFGAPLGRFLWGPSDRWPIAPIPAFYRRMQPSDVETLVLNGNVDFSTPAENTERDLMPHLRNGTHVVLAEMGHIGDLWTVQPATTHRILTSFLETGVADTSSYRYVPMDFSVRWGYPLLAKLTLAFGALTILLLLGLIWLAARFVRRRRRRRKSQTPP